MNRNIPKTILVGILFALCAIPMLIIWLIKPPRNIQKDNYRYKCIEGMEVGDPKSGIWTKYIAYKFYSREEVEGIGLSQESLNFYFRKCEI